MEKFIKTYENFTSKPNIIKHGQRIKYKDKDDSFQYGTYIRDTLLKGEFSFITLFTKVKSIIQDDKIGRIKVDKDKLIAIDNEH